VTTTTDFCEKHDKNLWLRLSDSRATFHDATRQFGKRKGMRTLAHQLTRTGKRLVTKKRELFNFVEQISCSLFGILDSEIEEFFNHKISELEGE
jgi:tRNA threonylcarbamoyladenosine modification (KEOPS) complex Cgi121 subunit